MKRARAIIDKALNELELSVRFDEGEGVLPSEDELSIFNVYNSTLDSRLNRALDAPYWFNTRSWPAFVEIRVEIDEGTLVFFAYRDRVFATTGPIFVLWLVSTSILLGWIAIVFLRNQVRSILRLANAAEAFGRGRDAPAYRPTGATEVRKAGYAFIAMRERIKRHLEQRTTMLAGVSHDLRTPLTRMKLALELQPDTKQTRELKTDVQEMVNMVEAYLDFARNEAEEETPEQINLTDLLTEVVRDANRNGEKVSAEVPEEIFVNGRRAALHRAISNLVNNGLFYADNVWISARREEARIEIAVEDDGPGITADLYDEAFKPFTRLDAARNANDGGIGLGLAVVRDVTRSHGGEVTLDRSAHGGLKATMRLPA